MVTRTKSVANETVNHYGVTIDKAEGLQTGHSFTPRNVELCVL